MHRRREKLEAELQHALERAGATAEAVQSVMAAGCRLDGLGLGAVPEHLRQADERLRDRVRALAAALDRMDAGRYGRCEVCDEPIGERRLDVLPTSTRCREHAG